MKEEEAVVRQMWKRRRGTIEKKIELRSEGVCSARENDGDANGTMTDITGLLNVFPRPIVSETTYHLSRTALQGTEK